MSIENLPPQSVEDQSPDGGASGNNPQTPRKLQFFKTKMCPWFFKGKCDRGRCCQFAHSEVELRAAPDLSCTSLCPTLRKSGMCNIPSCKYAHTTTELRATGEVFKTAICVKWLVGRCTAGMACRHAHGVEELRKDIRDSVTGKNGELMHSLAIGANGEIVGRESRRYKQSRDMPRSKNPNNKFNPSITIQSSRRDNDKSKNDSDEVYENDNTNNSSMTDSIMLNESLSAYNKDDAIVSIESNDHVTEDETTASTCHNDQSSTTYDSNTERRKSDSEVVGILNAFSSMSLTRISSPSSCSTSAASHTDDNSPNGIQVGRSDEISSVEPRHKEEYQHNLVSYSDFRNNGTRHSSQDDDENFGILEDKGVVNDGFLKDFDAPLSGIFWQNNNRLFQDEVHNNNNNNNPHKTNNLCEDSHLNNCLNCTSNKPFPLNVQNPPSRSASQFANPSPFHKTNTDNTNHNMNTNNNNMKQIKGNYNEGSLQRVNKNSSMNFQNTAHNSSTGGEIPYKGKGPLLSTPLLARAEPDPRGPILPTPVMYSPVSNGGGRVLGPVKQQAVKQQTRPGKSMIKDPVIGTPNEKNQTQHNNANANTNTICNPNPHDETSHCAILFSGPNLWGIADNNCSASSSMY